MAGTVQVPYLSKEGHDLVLWTDPKKTGVVVAVTICLYAFFFFTMLPLLSIFSYAAGIFLLGCMAWSKLGKSIGKPMPEMPAVFREGVSAADYKAHCDAAKPHIDKAVANVHDVVTCKDLVKTIKVVGACLVLGKVASFVSIFLLSFVAFLLMFIMPKVYELNKDQVDQGVSKIKVEADRAYSRGRDEVNKIVKKIPSSAKKTA